MRVRVALRSEIAWRTAEITREARHPLILVGIIRLIQRLVGTREKRRITTHARPSGDDRSGANRGCRSVPFANSRATIAVPGSQILIGAFVRARNTIARTISNFISRPMGPPRVSARDGCPRSISTAPTCSIGTPASSGRGTRSGLVSRITS